MGSIVTKYGECTAMTIILVISLILGSVGIALLMLILTAAIGIVLLALSGIFFLVALGLLIKMLHRTSFSRLSTWCKFNVVFCLVVFITILAEIIVGAVHYTKTGTLSN